jgi:hypothetical protein
MDTVLNSGFPTWLLIVVMLWSLPWKGFALWKAAQLSHKKWFIVLLVANTFAILDIFYIYYVARKYSVEIVNEK